ncbi:MAG TPA: Z1 domain-containing protein [Mycobacteriales bacterium]|jgi:hypothetical protein|nr:Z1 domain-containing protein [Mycobacteriales bacterium]
MRERDRLDAGLVARGLPDDARRSVWTSIDAILAHGPLAPGGHAGATGLALGYVQSGKTTAITALAAAAADAGYRVVVTVLGSTRLLLGQNAARLTGALGIGEREDYRWIHVESPAGATRAREMREWLGRGRVLLVSVLKHAGRLTSLADVLARAGVGDEPVLVIDDEADQASLNTQVNQATVSRTYAALSRLRAAVPNHLYVQFTATPYAPLLLEPEDHLRPDFVELLQPGPGYTGGREFFVDHADVVVRPIPTLDEQPPKSLPTLLPRSLVSAVGAFVAGTAMLLGADPTSAPVSMLVHSTQRNDVQERYHYLLRRLLRRWAADAEAATTVAELPPEVTDERVRIARLGGRDVDPATFLEQVRYVLREATPWLVNSASDVDRIDWRAAPVHLLVGGNKLDRGFTVEGLTVTYMNRPPSDQVDTLEQRARAFGYRGDLLPYCQFFATPRTLKLLREIVDTEYDLRASLRDWLAAGNDVAGWAEQIGLLLPEGTRPTRQAVLGALVRFNERPTWHQLRRPSLEPVDVAANAALVAGLGLLDAPRVAYGRLEHRTLHLPLDTVLDGLLEPWAGVGVGTSPGWRHAELVDFLRRLPEHGEVPVVLLEHPQGGPRRREWDPELGFVNLLQGADPRPVAGQAAYRGDRAIGNVEEDPERVVVEVHRVRATDPAQTPELFTLAVHAGRRHVVRKG